MPSPARSPGIQLDRRRARPSSGSGPSRPSRSSGSTRPRSPAPATPWCRPPGAGSPCGSPRATPRPTPSSACATHLEEHVPWGAELTFTVVDTGEATQIDATGPAYDAARAAFAEAWDGTPPVDMGVGGSIPFIAEFLEAFPEASVLVTGVEDPDTRAHGANEGLHLPSSRRCCSPRRCCCATSAEVSRHGVTPATPAPSPRSLPGPAACRSTTRSARSRAGRPRGTAPPRSSSRPRTPRPRPACGCRTTRRARGPGPAPACGPTAPRSPGPPGRPRMLAAAPTPSTTSGTRPVAATAPSRSWVSSSAAGSRRRGPGAMVRSRAPTNRSSHPKREYSQATSSECTMPASRSRATFSEAKVFPAPLRPSTRTSAGCRPRRRAVSS